MAPKLWSLLPVILFGARACVAGAPADGALKFGHGPEIKTCSINEIYHAALAEGGVVTCWHGGDEKNQQDELKQAFEKQFPGITLNMTVDLSKYHDARLDEQLANGNVSVNSIILQTVQDYPHWAADLQPFRALVIKLAVLKLTAAPVCLVCSWVPWANTLVS